MPYTRKLVLDRGLQHGVLAGQPVIDARGVVGQMTRVLPLSSEVTLITDRRRDDAGRSARTGERSVAFGGSPPGRSSCVSCAATPTSAKATRW